jgi:hypothetical protein
MVKHIFFDGFKIISHHLHPLQIVLVVSYPTLHA